MAYRKDEEGDLLSSTSQGAIEGNQIKRQQDRERHRAEKQKLKTNVGLNALRQQMEKGGSPAEQEERHDEQVHRDQQLDQNPNSNATLTRAQEEAKQNQDADEIEATAEGEVEKAAQQNAQKNEEERYTQEQG